MCQKYRARSAATTEPRELSRIIKHEAPTYLVFVLVLRPKGSTRTRSKWTIEYEYEYHFIEYEYEIFPAM